jgi:hypothetical protein
MHSCCWWPIASCASVGQGIAIGGGLYTARYAVAFAVRRYGHVVAGGATVDAGRVGLNPLEQWRPDRAFARGPLAHSHGSATIALHASFPHSEIGESLRAQKCDGIDTFLNGLTTGVSPMTLSQHSTDHVQERARSTTEATALAARQLSAALLDTISRSVSARSCRASAPVPCSR